MINRKIYLTLAIILLTIASFFTGYFTMQRYISKIENKESATAKTTVKLPSMVIDQNTKIIKKEIYIRANNYVLKQTITPNEEIIGLDKSLAEDYFKNKGYKLDYFTSEKVEISKEIDNKWPPNVYIIMENNGKVAVFETDQNSNLKLKQTTEINLEDLPFQEKQDLKRGVIKETYEDAEQYINEDLDS